MLPDEIPSGYFSYEMRDDSGFTGVGTTRISLEQYARIMTILYEAHETHNKEKEKVNDSEVGRLF